MREWRTKARRKLSWFERGSARQLILSVTGAKSRASCLNHETKRPRLITSRIRHECHSSSLFLSITRCSGRFKYKCEFVCGRFFFPLVETRAVVRHTRCNFGVHIASTSWIICFFFRFAAKETASQTGPLWEIRTGFLPKRRLGPCPYTSLTAAKRTVAWNIHTSTGRAGREGQEGQEKAPNHATWWLLSEPCDFLPF